MKNLKLSLGALLICSSMSVLADDSLSLTGYFRAGTGITLDSSETSDNVEEKNENFLGRMGNEYNTWINLDVHKSITGKNGAKVELTAEAYGWLKDPEDSGPWAGDNGYGADTGAFYVGEVSAKFSNLDFLPSTASLKVGQMAISEDIHVLDYKFKSTAGTGVIYKDENKQLAFMVNSDRNTKAIDGEYSIGKIDTKLTISQSLTSNDSSISGLLAYNQKSFLGLSEGTTKYILQAGAGVTAGNLSRNYVSNVDGSAYRFIIDGHGTAGNLILNPVLWAETTDYGDTSKKMYTSVSMGGRITQPITENLQMMYETFVNQSENYQGADLKDGITYKVAVGPGVQIDIGEWVRPTARFTLTYIGGEKSITGFTKNGELRLGTQFEAWF